MAVPQTRNTPAEPASPAPLAPVRPSTPPQNAPRPRAGAAWVRVGIAAFTLVVLSVFVLQNTRDVEVTFLWMHGALPLAAALLIAAVGVIILAMAVGAARVSRVNRRARQRH
ncbi:hypothetical protein [Plantactinospora sp. CA-290183]|uniref:hypothetical protein n=1 Tax=Plantactinospora sp. CA-290183 TaxID=3240006 RepID=UPI003D93F986